MTARTNPEDFRDRDLHELHAHEAGLQPVGYQEIAARLDVDEDTVRKWRNRQPSPGNRGGWLPFPDPEPTTVGGRPWWWWAVIEQWARDTNRLSA